MPFLNGYDFAAKLKELQKDLIEKLPIISYSSTSLDEDEIEKQLACGFNGFCEKPATMLKLKEILQSMIKDIKFSI